MAEMLNALTVRPAAVVLLPQTNTPRGDTFAQAFSNCDLPRPGSPTTNTCGSERTGTNAEF